MSRKQIIEPVNIRGPHELLTTMFYEIMISIKAMWKARRYQRLHGTVLVGGYMAGGST